MLRKETARIIAIDSQRDRDFDPDPTPQGVKGKRQFFGNEATQRSVLVMHRNFVRKVARFYRLPPALVEEQIIEAIQERRVA